MGYKHGTPAERLARHTDKSGDCWIWAASTRFGYGRINVDHRNQPAFRVAWELEHGPIPKGLVLDHLCRNVACVRPSHLEPVTPSENARRGNAAVTHCPHGHAYSEGNTYINKQGSRMCRTCNRNRAAAYYVTHRAERIAYAKKRGHPERVQRALVV